MVQTAHKTNMQVFTPGHRYVLESFEDTNSGQVLQFIEKQPESEGSTKLVTVNDGTTNEEVLAVLIDRLNYLQAKHPCRENAIVLTKLEESLMWLNKRTADRKARSVEGTNAK
jgi:hypothetical protein